MTEEKSTKQVDLREIWAIVFRRKWLIILPLVIITAVSFASTYFLEPKYESYTIVWIDKPSSVSRELLSIVGEHRETREEMQSRALALETEITSKNFLLQLIEGLKLDEDAQVTRQAAKMRESSPQYSLEQIRNNLLVEKLREQISVAFHGWDQIKISVVSNNPVLAREMADGLAEILGREKAKYEMEKILDNQSFTDQQLQKTEYYYSLAVDSLNRARARLSKLQLPDNIAAETNQAAISSGIERVKLERADYVRESASLASRLDQYNLSGARLKYTDTIVELRTSIDGLIATYGSMMEQFGFNEQNVIDVNIRLNNDIRQLERIIASAVARQYASYPANQQEMLTRYFIVQENLDILTSKEKRLQRPLDDLERRVMLVPQLESEISELENRVENARRYRDAFRSEETTAGILSEQAKDRTKYKVIEPAQLPLYPVWPDKRKIILIGFILGMALGGSFVFLTELFDNSFKRVDDVETVLGIRVLATIPRIDKLRVMR